MRFSFLSYVAPKLTNNCYAPDFVIVDRDLFLVWHWNSRAPTVEQTPDHPCHSTSLTTQKKLSATRTGNGGAVHMVSMTPRAERTATKRRQSPQGWRTGSQSLALQCGHHHSRPNSAARLPSSPNAWLRYRTANKASLRCARCSYKNRGVKHPFVPA
jgi:hypothetical protein